MFETVTSLEKTADGTAAAPLTIHIQEIPTTRDREEARGAKGVRIARFLTTEKSMIFRDKYSGLTLVTLMISEID